MTYKIVRMSDSMDCEDCGPSFDEGYTIHKDGVLVVDKTPYAHCYDGTRFSSHNPFADILALEGIQVTEEIDYDYGN